MDEFKPGQRWASNAESQMGLGTVLSVENRIVTIVFLATGETRGYSKETAPLTRVVFSPGESVLSQDGWVLTIESLKEKDGILTYTGVDQNGNPAMLEEGQLSNFIQLTRPAERLLNGQIDRDKWFQLRHQTLLLRQQLNASDVIGLTGCRTSLISHQLYIAHEVANRYAPRVMLADEVGLGKTIEAGLIVHHQLLTERAKRVLIVVPENLLHQWLVEMLRRFNLHFGIFDEERCTAIEQNTDEDDPFRNNPFHSEQLVLCELAFLAGNTKRLQQVVAGDWDLLVVDEAHHLQWSNEKSSVEYDVVQQLAEKTKGVLLLTATPEQLGKASHFARLRLLDPDRFSDFGAFSDEEKSYEPIANAVDFLLSNKELDDSDREELLQAFGTETDNRLLIESLQTKSSKNQDQSVAREELVEHLLDRHGTGRVLFRNTRATVRGFPKRKMTPYPLALPDAYQLCLNAPKELPPTVLPCPELLYQSSNDPHQVPWSRFDPRIDWLLEILGQLKPKKALVITSNAQSALDISRALKKRTGVHYAVFHEGLSILERDRAAAYFADKDAGSQVLICSEIGSEGRNFQFAHHMILLDLPLNPDLLEQRIGRLDRIGQTETINIHVPYLENTAQAVLFRWYHEGLDAFEHTCPAGLNVYQKVEDTLIEALYQPDVDINDLILKTLSYHRDLNEALHRGRDRLLEYNSCRPHIARILKGNALKQDKGSTLPAYMDAIFDCFGVDIEEHSEACFIIRPSEGMLNPFPGLPDDGKTITYDRKTALAKEDVHYITWEHPMVLAAMDMVLSSELGNTALIAVDLPGITSGTTLLECLFVFESPVIEKLQSSRYLPPTTVRIIIDDSHKRYDTRLDPALIREKHTPVDPETGNKIIRAKKDDIRELVLFSEKLARQQMPEILASAHAHANQTLTKEIDRLTALSEINPNVRQEEIAFFQQQSEALNHVLDSATLRLDALRVILVV